MTSRRCFQMIDPFLIIEEAKFSKLFSLLNDSEILLTKHNLYSFLFILISKGKRKYCPLTKKYIISSKILMCISSIIKEAKNKVLFSIFFPQDCFETQSGYFQTYFQPTSYQSQGANVPTGSVCTYVCMYVCT